VPYNDPDSIEEADVSDVLQVTQAGHVRTIRLNRPAVKNALSPELAWGVVGAIEEAGRDDEVWVVAITGTADAFCAGLDLKGGAPRHPAPAQTAYLDDIDWVGRFLLSCRTQCDKPVVAGINGVAVGAGLSLAMAADIRIIARSARLMAGYPRIGGSPDGGLTFTLSQAIGYEKAMRFMLENRTVLGEEAVALGMAGEVVDDERLGARLAEYCAMLCERSPITLRLTKRGMERATRSIDLEAQLRFELANIRRAFASEDGREARQAFLEKRSPVFKGR
jgi:2-(1,2-epoxy-1,2-dihydrophenyl)acetyl-CoA isomerase